MQAAIKVLVSALLMFVRVVYVAPLTHLYMYGPALHGWGFWQGQHNADICAALTHGSAEFWAKTSAAAAECSVLIDHHQYAFVLGVTSVIAVCLFFSLLLGLTVYLCAVRPISVTLARCRF